MENKNIDLKSYVDGLIADKKLPENLDPGVIEQMKLELLDRVENRINAVIINNLTETRLEEFNKILDSEKNDIEVQSFLKENVPNLTELIATELIVFRQTYLS